MDKSGAAVCEFFLKAACGKGGMCPFRHISGEKTVVCKHWLRGLCKKGDQCEFLHEYDMTKMPECYFYSKFGECSNKECPFLHIDPESKIKDCPWYDRGFCKHGPLCRHRHTRRVICVNYLVGFCPEGPSCKFMQTLSAPASARGLPETRLEIVGGGGRGGESPWFLLKLQGAEQTEAEQPGGDVATLAAQPATFSRVWDEPKRTPVRAGHSRMWAPPQAPPSALLTRLPSGGPSQPLDRSKTVLYNSFQQSNNPPLQRSSSLIQLTSQNSSPNQQRAPQVIGVMQSQNSSAGNRGPRPLEQVTCYKCGEKGHYANRCTKGHLAFLSGQ
ncbi:hypothetical protein J1605_013724 [Eschrichtius robustus]|uniref:Cleavage and polyadenylation specificity factor subunit 4 n=1 Tax=Eschrichtius robustus TaxID=9764 RepID=A0AB34GIJ4_ESCRO|nr:hypothetical protein J1605_013724 [Eschrichtius robustus]